ncbi:hypothetical protein [Prescottella agglutinans]|uniref:Helix-turn-helix domain-containing protein n=1 Tax=Prescottella agglutinans TaxID=1644129 RepID=A0ABT6MJP4_9NOCA|nr:hypothetical protein [Prescottella agglutinans]MDH6284538.1 hypothetical protein [Prescottella agglutinans]
MSEMSVVDAATTLGVSSRQVERLAQAGDVVVTRRVGRSMLLDSSSVHRCAQMGRRRGRPWSEQAAWGALGLLSGLSVDWLPAAHRTRLRDRLRRSTADEVAYFARRRQARILRMRGWGAEMTGPGSVLIAGGVSALDADLQLAERFGLTTGHRDGVDGYVLAAHVEAIVGAFGLVPDLEGDVTLRVISDLHPVLTDGAVPVAVVAVDLMESLSARERRAGARVLQELLDDLR